MKKLLGIVVISFLLSTKAFAVLPGSKFKLNDCRMIDSQADGFIGSFIVDVDQKLLEISMVNKFNHTLKAKVSILKVSPEKIFPSPTRQILSLECPGV